MNSQIEQFLEENPKATKIQLLDFIAERFKLVPIDEANAELPIRGMFKNMRDKDHISPIFPNRGEITDATRQREVKRGFKIRTEGESSKADDTRKK